jgi:Mce-associated membrane protein
MPPQERLPEALDPDGYDGPSPNRTEATSSEPSLAEAEEAVGLAEARAQAARARATQLNHKANATAGNHDETTDAASDDDVKAKSPSSRVPRRRIRSRPRLLHRPGRKTVALGVAAALACGALGASGYVLKYRQTAAEERRRTAEFAAAARQEAVTLMSIDANNARDDVQRIIDISTGQFKVGMLLNGEDIVKSVEQSKVSTKVAVEGVAVESITNDSAVVLVAAKAEATNPDKTPPPRQWRIIMTLQRESGQPKISDIEVLR